MKTLTKKHLMERNELSLQLQHAYAELETEVECYNEAINEQFQKVADAQKVYQSVVQRSRDWCEDVAAEIQEEIDSHHEKWQDSERGQAFVQWQQEYDQYDLEDIDLEQPCQLTFDIGDQSEALEGLSEEPS